MSTTAVAIGGSDIHISETLIRSLSDTLQGDLIEPGDPGYDQARRVWNGMIDRRPAMIVRCHGVDVVIAVSFVRSAGISVSVRGELHGGLVVGTGVCYVGDIEEGEQLLQPLRGFVEHQAVLDEGVPSGHLYYEKSEYLSQLTPDLIEVLVEHGSQVRSPYSFVGLFQLGGAVGRVDEHDTAYTHRDAAFSLAISASWQEPGRDRPEHRTFELGARLASREARQLSPCASHV